MSKTAALFRNKMEFFFFSEGPSCHLFNLIVGTKHYKMMMKIKLKEEEEIKLKPQKICT